MKDIDLKWFCTLNLFLAQRYRKDRKNVLKLYLISKASKFQTAGEWHDQDEHKKWDPQVVVLFQPNAWVDGETHRHGLKEVYDTINDHLEEVGMRGVNIEDNLSSHHIDIVHQFWRDELEYFERQVFAPPNMTEVLGVVDDTRGQCINLSARRCCGIFVLLVRLQAPPKESPSSHSLLLRNAS